MWCLPGLHFVEEDHEMPFQWKGSFTRRTPVSYTHLDVYKRQVGILSPWVVMGPYPLTRAGNRYIVVVTDMMSRRVEAKAVRKADADTISLPGGRSVPSLGIPRGVAHRQREAAHGPQVEADVRQAAHTTCLLYTSRCV